MEKDWSWDLYKLLIYVDVDCGEWELGFAIGSEGFDKVEEFVQQELDKAREEGRREGSEITSRYISDFVISESGKSGRKEILEYIDKLSKLKQ